MAFNKIPFIKLPDIPKTSDVGLRQYYTQLNRMAKSLSGNADSDDRALLVGDLTSNGSEILASITDVPAWDDLRFPAQSIKQGATNPPGWVKLTGLGEVYCLGFDKTTSEDVYFVVQLPHHWKEGTELRPHIHWTSQSGSSGNVAWVLEYTIASTNETFPSTTTDSMVVPNPAQYVHTVDAWSPIFMSGKRVSSVLLCRVYRDTSNVLDTLNEDALLLEIDFHYQVDSFGSSREYYKD